MQTKFIVHGGFSPEKVYTDTSPFYIEILKDAPEGAVILLVCFAKEKERVPAATAEVMERFENNKWQKSITFKIAGEDSFLQQVETSDVIYFHGGKSSKLLQTLKQFPDFRSLLENKTIAGESAGANILATYFYSPSADATYEGLGFIPVKIIPHYTVQFARKLNGVGEDVELLLLREYEYKVFLQ